ncbi:MAG TPA: hypothetical protein VFZ52_21075 [Chryseolinea sp.]
MKTTNVSILALFAVLIFNGCDYKNHDKRVEVQLKALTAKLTELETTDALDTFIQYYDSQAISMPEYQVSLRGRKKIENFYREIFSRQQVIAFQRTSQEFIHMGSAIVEIGSFKKEYKDLKTDTLVGLTGKYWLVWDGSLDEGFKIKGESFGFFHPVPQPALFTVGENQRQPDEGELLGRREIPFELKAYNALMEKGVRNRDGNLRSEFFTPDGRFYPYADTAIVGLTRIKSHLIEYSSRGHVSIDSIMCYTFDFSYFENYVLEYDMFKVKWSVPNFSGRTEGKGIRIWKRLPDGSLRLYREIGTHNHLL